MSEVLPFARDADYLYARANHRRQHGELIQALELMRSACSRAPKNEIYRMDLADLLCEMGCHRLSMAVLLQAFSDDPAMHECLFGLCCNLMALREMPLAHSLLTWFLLEDPMAMRRREVVNIFSELLRHHVDGYDAKDHAQRARYLLRKSELYEARGDAESAIRLLRRAKSIDSDNQQINAALGLLLANRNECDEALSCFSTAMATDIVTIKTRCAVARGYFKMGMTDHAKRALDQACALSEGLWDDEQLIFAAGAIGQDKIALSMVNMLLDDAPNDVELLFTKGIALLNIGGSAIERARSCFAKITRIDPHNCVAQYYFELSKFGTVPEGTHFNYDFDVPQDAAAQQREHIKQLAAEGGHQQFEPSHALQGSLRWLLQRGHAEDADLALSILGQYHCAVAGQLMREHLLHPKLLKRHRNLITAYLFAHGMKAPYVSVDAFGRVTDASVLRTSQHRYSPAQRRVLTRAFAAKLPDKGHRAIVIEDIWRRYLNARAHHPPRIRQTSAWSAALIALYRKAEPSDMPAVRSAAKVFHCAPRLVSCCMRRIIRALGAQPHNEHTKEDNHETD